MLGIGETIFFAFAYSKFFAPDAVERSHEGEAPIRAETTLGRAVLIMGYMTQKEGKI